MKRKPSREIEIFSMSAIDLFAAAMSAFAVLTVVLMPYYQKEVLEAPPQLPLDTSRMGEQVGATEESVTETEVKKKSLERQVSAMRANVSDVKSEEEKLIAEYDSAQRELKAKQAAASRAVPVPTPDPTQTRPAPAPKKAIDTFRFLGMKTTKERVSVLVDLNDCMGGHEKAIKDATNRIITSLQDYHELQIVGFQHVGGQPRISTWPSAGAFRSMTESNKQGAISFANSLTNRFDGSSAMLAAFQDQFNGRAEAIFLVSDGLPNPVANGGMMPSQLGQRLTQQNGGRKEIHTVVVGPWFDYQDSVEFMEGLAKRNGGQFMALASPQPGACG